MEWPIPAGERHGSFTLLAEYSVAVSENRKKPLQKGLCDCGHAEFFSPSEWFQATCSNCYIAPTKISNSRAKKYQVALDVITAYDLKKLLVQHGYRCWICTLPLVSVTWDHVQPVARGGGHVVSNLKPSCPWCNSRKGALYPFTDDMRAEIAEVVRGLRSGAAVAVVAGSTAGSR